MRTALLILFCHASLFAQSGTMSGTWKLDTSSSDFGRFELARHLTLTIEPSADGFQFFYDYRGPSQYLVRTITVDGNDHSTGIATETAAAARLDVGLLVRYQQSGANSPVYFELWKLSNDGLTLTRVRQLRGGAQQDESKLVFRRISD